MAELLAHAGDVGLAGLLFISIPAIAVVYIGRRNKKIEKQLAARKAAREAQAQAQEQGVPKV